MKSILNLVFLIKPYCYMTKISRQKLKYFENEKSFWGEIKSISHHFQRAFSCQKLSQTWECVCNNNAYIPIFQISLSGSRIAHISSDLYKKSGIFPVKIVRIRMFLYYKNKARGDIFEENCISKKRIHKWSNWIELN